MVLNVNFEIYFVKKILSYQILFLSTMFQFLYEHDLDLQENVLLSLEIMNKNEVLKKQFLKKYISEKMFGLRQM